MSEDESGPTATTASSATPASAAIPQADASTRGKQASGGPARRRRAWAWGGVAAGAVAVGLGVGAAAWPDQAQRNAQAPTARAALPSPTPILAAGSVVRGVVRPASSSRVGTQAGGVASLVAVEPGDAVESGQTLARVRSPRDGSVEVVAAPRSGTVTVRSVSEGDSVMPGAILFVVADASVLRIETTDVDEYLVARVRRGQRVLVSIPALDVHRVGAVVRSVGPQPVGTSAPDATGAVAADHYPVTLDLVEPVDGLRIGMAARVTLVE